ncbi:MAG: putative DNA binding domain-containing protein [Patescibacteria group bacterium]|nr:putative DNA binding domain-containing protein [Patescibacteria group bacterium]
MNNFNEGENIELKKTTAEKEAAMQDLCAFANKNGGKIYFGIDPSGKILGQQISDNTLRHISDLINSSFDPKIYPLLNIETLNNKKVLVIDIPNEICSDKPYRYKGIAYKRVGSESQKMSRNEEIQMWQAKTPMKDYTALTIEVDRLENYIDILEVEKLKNILKSQNKTQYSEISLEDLIISLDLCKKENGKFFLTYAGILIIGKAEIIQKFIPGHEVIYQEFDEDDVKYVKREDFKGSFISILEKITEYIQVNNKFFQIKIGLFRFDFQQFPLAAIREAILNAFIHRDFILQSPIYINKYKDRVEIKNIGGFLGNITPGNIIHHQSILRNELLAKVFQKIGLVERGGFGVDIIYREMLSNGKMPPEYTAYPDSIILTLYDQSFDEYFAKFVASYEKKNSKFSIDELIILSYLRKKKDISLKEADKLTQRLNLNRTSLILEDMVKRCLLERSSRTFYKLSYSTYQQLEKTIDYFRDRGIDKRKYKEILIDFINDNGKITNSQTQQLLGMSVDQAKRYLQALVKSKVLRLEGAKGMHRKDSYYVLV